MLRIILIQHTHVSNCIKLITPILLGIDQICDNFSNLLEVCTFLIFRKFFSCIIDYVIIVVSVDLLIQLLIILILLVGILVIRKKAVVHFDKRTVIIQRKVLRCIIKSGSMQGFCRLFFQFNGTYLVLRWIIQF
ncbi:transmembrane protein, putative (macronuclear) [Tetrahymena thermophila SB210]|uniref:Transmembrane protein, putative n=1 Tax=Tetrahymena thermophila (strain SB210) TaxID=312017 RepID=W7XDT8_TETTS|nr:transmembrane protein, putative [Tetrahymena thermophila SB210]EWS75767.1 transmembrane protein, putative [Tetrahymena thermophila SB210]|eukprot:XP_012651689.1 transmembrane protein, putative [Tetrahymena thermophila SB210]